MKDLGGGGGGGGGGTSNAPRPGTWMVGNGGSEMNAGRPGPKREISTQRRYTASRMFGTSGEAAARESAIKCSRDWKYSSMSSTEGTID